MVHNAMFTQKVEGVVNASKQRSTIIGPKAETIGADETGRIKIFDQAVMPEVKIL